MSIVCPDGDRFKDGITNGAEWYSIYGMSKIFLFLILISTGSMQDYNYVMKGSYAITLEIGCWKHPPPQNLPQIWEDNRNSMLQFLLQAQIGMLE
jgi:hypothetical protein